MGFAGFLGYLLIAGGPGLVIYCVFIGRKAFLALLTLACAFLWLTTLILTAALFRGFAPLGQLWGQFAAALVVGVLVEEAVRCGCWRLHRRLVTLLREAALTWRGGDGPVRMSVDDERLLALTQGFAHGLAHSTFFYFSWLPLALGDGTFYADACPAMSYYLAAGLVSLAFLLLHTFSMVVAFEGAGGGRPWLWPAAAAAHMGAALLTLGNLTPGGCVAVVPLLLLLGLGAAAAAGCLCWSVPDARRQHVPVPSTEELHTGG